MELEEVMLSEISQTERDKYCMLSLNVESKNQLENITKRNGLKDIDDRLVVPSGERVGEESKIGVGD